jgi:hypothetical protein
VKKIKNNPNITTNSAKKLFFATTKLFVVIGQQNKRRTVQTTHLFTLTNDPRGGAEISSHTSLKKRPGPTDSRKICELMGELGTATSMQLPGTETLNVGREEKSTAENPMESTAANV